MIDFESHVYAALASLWHGTDNPAPKYNREAVLQVLVEIADGQHSGDHLYFMRELARCLVNADVSAPKATAGRAQAVMQATGLAGKPDPYAAFIGHVERCRGLDGYTQAGAVRSAIAAGLYPGGCDVEALFKSADQLATDRYRAACNFYATK